VREQIGPRTPRLKERKLVRMGALRQTATPLLCSAARLLGILRQCGEGAHGAPRQGDSFGKAGATDGRAEDRACASVARGRGSAGRVNPRRRSAMGRGLAGGGVFDRGGGRFRRPCMGKCLGTKRGRPLSRTGLRAGPVRAIFQYSGCRSHFLRDYKNVTIKKFQYTGNDRKLLLFRLARLARGVYRAATIRTPISFG
jgi:hypothetical protein